MSETLISVKNLDKSFRIPRDKQSSLKGTLINMAKGKKGYDEYHVLKNISFDIKKGEFYGIVGRNGSGKSTLLKILAGIYVADNGSVSVNGRLTPFIELGVGFNPELTGRENIFLNGALLGFNRKEMMAMYDDIVEFAELENFMDLKLKNYSSGMQVRLAFSIAIRVKSDILLIDEVLAVGDVNFQQKCFEYFYSLKKGDQTVVFVSHDMEAVRRFCDKAILIDSGKIVVEGKPQEVTDEYMVKNFEAKQNRKISQQENITTEKNNDQDNDNAEESMPQVAIVKEFKILGKKRLSSSQKLRLSFKYEILKNKNVELRVAINKDGISFAHINTRDLILPSKPGIYKMVFEGELNSLMDGEHQLTCGVFDKGSGEQLDLITQADSFFVTDRDETRYGFLRIKGRWSVPESINQASKEKQVKK